MISRKAAVLGHWVLMGFLVAIGIVFFMTTKPEFLEPKGMWEITVKNMLLDVQEEKLNLELQGYVSAAHSVLELAQQGGFLEESPCGKFNDKLLWNNKDTTCWPKVKENFLSLLKNKYSSSSDLNYDFELKDKKVIAKTDKKGKVYTAISNIPTTEMSTGSRRYEMFLTKPFYLRYTYSYDWQINLGYDLLQEYDTIAQQANKLLECKDHRDLNDCIEQNLLESWNLNFCLRDLSSATGLINAAFEDQSNRHRAFCIESPSGLELYNEDKKKQKVQYSLALDFTPELPFPPENLEANIENNQILISFSPEIGISNYKLYYTNWLEASDNQPVEEAFSNIPTAEGFGYFYEVKEITAPATEECPTEKASNTAYLCQNKVLFVLENPQLISGSYKLSITSVQEDKESLLPAFREISIS